MAYKKWFADESDYGKPYGFGGNYVEYLKMRLPECTNDQVGDVHIQFSVFANKAARDAGKLPFRVLTYAVPAEMVVGFSLESDPAVMRQFVYDRVQALIPDLADAVIIAE